MELTPGFPPAALAGPVVAQLADHQLAHGVVEVGRVVGAAGRLLARRALVLVGGLHEQPLRLLHAHPLGVEPDGGEKTDISQQRVGNLADAGFR